MKTIAQDDPIVKPMGWGEVCLLTEATLPSQLEAANRLLLARRAALVGRPPAADADPAAAPPLPTHLGWGSAALSRCLPQPTPPAVSLVLPAIPTAEPEAVAPQAVAPEATTLPIDHGIAQAMLRGRQAAAGRLWLLLRHSDHDGRGWVARSEAQQRFAGPDAPQRLCERRQLDNLLRQGEGVFWQLRDGRIWLRSLARVAQTLGVARLSGRTVLLPAALLAGSLRQARAALYAAFHAGRPQAGAPIARATLRDLSGVSPRAQRQYDRVVGVQRSANFAAAGLATAGTTAEFAYRCGGAAFVLTDWQGQRGAPGRRYLVRQLPNSYTAPFASRPNTSRRRAVNRRLRQGLAQHGAQGNSRTRCARRYHDGGQTVRGGGYLRDYTGGRAAFWIALPGGEDG